MQVLIDDVGFIVKTISQTLIMIYIKIYWFETKKNNLKEIKRNETYGCCSHQNRHTKAAGFIFYELINVVEKPQQTLRGDQDIYNDRSRIFYYTKEKQNE